MQYIWDLSLLLVEQRAQDIQEVGANLYLGSSYYFYVIGKYFHKKQIVSEIVLHMKIKEEIEIHKVKEKELCTPPQLGCR